ncbi:hypothetical protein ACGI6H_22815, partial [Escherichia coli]
ILGRWWRYKWITFHPSLTLQRGVASFSLQLAEGRADLYTEMPVKVSGFKQPIDDAEWTITTLTHTVSPDNGFTTSIELEVKIDDLEME